MKNLTRLLAVLAIPIIMGYASPIQKTQFGPKIDPILDIERTAPFYSTKEDRINRLARGVADSTKKYFPRGRVIILEEKNKYLVSKILNGDLEISLCILPNEKYETIIRENISNDKHGQAIKIIDANFVTKTSVHDKDPYTQGNCILKITKQGGETLTEIDKKITDNSYRVLLETYFLKNKK